jgi:hypothetical protein
MEMNWKWRFAVPVAATALLLASCSDNGQNGLTDPNGALGDHQTTQAFMYDDDATVSITLTDADIVNGACWDAAYDIGSVGTGLINPFLSIQRSGEEHGYNTDDTPLPLDDTRSTFTDALPLNLVPNFTPEAGDLFGCPSDEYREFILDANESNNLPNAQFSIDAFDLYLCKQDGGADPATYSPVEFQAAITSGECHLIYDLDGDILGATDAATSGSGNVIDYRILVPNEWFTNIVGTECPYNGDESNPCDWYVVLYSHMGGAGGDWVTGATFEEFSTIKRAVPPQLTLVKVVINDDGGEAVPADWTLTATGDGGISGSAPVGPSPVQAGVQYALSESAVTGYEQVGDWSCDGGDFTAPNLITLADGDAVTCTVTNDDIAPTLALVKVVINDDGGTAVKANWTLTATGSGGFSGAADVAATPVNAGVQYALSESAVAGYEQVGDWSCDGGDFTAPNLITLALDEDVTCTVTNDDIAPTLALVKVVINDDGGEAVKADWTLTATGAGGFSGAADVAATPVTAGVEYTLSESVVAGYEQVGDWSCDGGTFVAPDKITLALGDDVTCTVTNDDIATAEWCSPGFWRNAKFDIWAATGLNANDPYTNYFDASTLKAGSPANPTLSDVLNNPQVYGGEAFNNVGSLLSAEHSGVDFTLGDPIPEDPFCPLNARGEEIEPPIE